jgi:DNA-binding beta-propeller fold protein YncE
MPQALGTLSNPRSRVLLVADGARHLLQVGLNNNAVLPPQAPIGDAPRHIWVEGSTIYLANASSNSLQILQPDGGSSTTGFPLGTVGQYTFLDDSSPQALVKVGTFLYVVLRGTDSNPDAGQKVVELDVTDPTNPDAGRTFDLSGLDLRPFDGGSAVARPSGIAAVGDGGILYVALNNLRPAPTLDPAGPGVLAKIDLNTAAVSRVDLPLNACLNAQWLVSTGDALFVSCGGAVVFDGGIPISTDRTGIVALNTQDQRIATWNASCDGGCIPPSVRRFATFGNRLYIGDQYGGRVFVMEKQLDAGTSILACPPDAGLSTVSDVISVP